MYEQGAAHWLDVFGVYFHSKALISLYLFIRLFFLFFFLDHYLPNVFLLHIRANPVYYNIALWTAAQIVLFVFET